MSLLNNMTIVLFLCHVLGDFQFQTQEMANVKAKSLSTLQKHLLIHALILAIIPILLFGWRTIPELWLLILLVWISHCIVDTIKYYLMHWKELRYEIVYVVDQLLHIVAIIFLSEFLFSSSLPTNLISVDIMKWLLLFLVITKPANITFKIVFKKYQFKTEAPTVQGAGGVIGNLERILSTVFLGMNQITAIGFIYTAKSIARFKEIEDSKGFAEYYLIGTLFSILYVAVAYIIIIII